MANDIAIENAEQVNSLFVPLINKQLIIPNVTIAELIGFVTPKERDNSPVWLLGDMEWRNTIIPVVSIEAYNGYPTPTNYIGARIAVLNGVSNQSNLPFWAVVTQGIPRLVKIEESNIVELESTPLQNSDEMAIEVNSEQAFIPNLDKIERDIVNLI